MDVNTCVRFPEGKIIKDAVPYATVYAEATNLLPPPQQPGLPDPNPGPQLPVDAEDRFVACGSIHYNEEENKSINNLERTCCVSDIVTGRVTLDKHEQDKAKEKAIFTIGNVNDPFPIGGFLGKEPGDEE